MRMPCLESGGLVSVSSRLLVLSMCNHSLENLEYAAAFFLLADHLRDAAHVCVNQVGDLQLAIAITRAYEGDDGPVLKEILGQIVLPEAASDGNRWMASWAFWMLGHRDIAVRSLIVSSSSFLSQGDFADNQSLLLSRSSPLLPLVQFLCTPNRISPTTQPYSSYTNNSAKRHSKRSKEHPRFHPSQSGNSSSATPDSMTGWVVTCSLSTSCVIGSFYKDRLPPKRPRMSLQSCRNTGWTIAKCFVVGVVWLWLICLSRVKRPRLNRRSPSHLQQRLWNQMRIRYWIVLGFD